MSGHNVIGALTINSIIPLMGVCYMLQYMDKATLGFTTQLGLPTDLVSTE
jgi:hypothetical protein